MASYFTNIGRVLAPFGRHQPDSSVWSGVVTVLAAMLVASVAPVAAAQSYGTGAAARPAPAQPAPASPRYASPPPPAQPVQRGAAQPSTPPARPADDDSTSYVLYIQPFVGGAYAHLTALDASNFDINSTDTAAEDVVVTSKGSGLRYGAAAGLNLLFVHLGARLAFTETDAFTLGTAVAEVALVPRLGPIEPSVRLGIGYAWQGNANYGNYTEQTSVYGLALGAGLGLDIRLGQVVGIGAAVDADLLNMSRSTDLGNATTIDAQSGNAVGVQVAVTGHLTLHI